MGNFFWSSSSSHPQQTGIFEFLVINSKCSLKYSSSTTTYFSFCLQMHLEIWVMSSTSISSNNIISLSICISWFGTIEVVTDASAWIVKDKKKVISTRHSSEVCSRLNALVYRKLKSFFFLWNVKNCRGRIEKRNTTK